MNKSSQLWKPRIIPVPRQITNPAEAGFVFLLNRSERFGCKAHGAQRPRHTLRVGEEVSTAQRRNRIAHNQ